VTFPRFNADNTVSSLNAADFRTAIGVTAAGTFATTNFTIVEEGGKLVIKHGGTVIASFSSAGALIAKDNVTAYGTP
jgi:hypothetical protein